MNGRWNRYVIVVVTALFVVTVPAAIVAGALPPQWEQEGTRLRIGVDDSPAVSSVLIDRWVEQAQLTASDGAPLDQFGNAVALSGDTALVGARFDDVGGNTDQGAAYVFTRSGEVWTEQAKLTASDGAQGELFGFSVALSGDTALVGAIFGSAAFLEGAAYVFTRSGETWTEQAKLTASDGAPGETFGFSVALSGDTALVGAAFGDAAYVFTRSGEVWTEQAKLTASDGAPGAVFGFSVALAENTTLVGATGVNNSQGAAYVFTRSGETWTEQAKLTASDGEGIAEFGNSGALSGDTALVGANFDGSGENTDRGAAYVFTRNGEVWSEQAKLTADDGALEDRFGNSVALLDDTAMIGAFRDDVGEHINEGAVYVFSRSGETWSQQAKLTSAEGAPNDSFGSSVALSTDTALVGAMDAADVDGTASRGAAYAFVLEELPPNVATIKGTVQSMGHCGAEAGPLVGTVVEITGVENTFTVETGDEGFYQAFLPDSESPVDITVSAASHVPVTVQDIGFSGGDILVQDFDLVLDAPCVTAEPTSFSFELESGQTATEILTLGNIDGAAELTWEITTAALGATGGSSLPSVQPIQLAGGVVDCDNEPGIIMHDDGSEESGYSGNPVVVNQAIFTDPFVPSVYPASFRAVCVAFFSHGPTSLDFDIVVFDDDGPDGAPGTELGVLPASVEGIPATTGQPVWFGFDISSLDLSIDSGSAYIGVRWAPSEPIVFLAADESQDRPVGFANGYWWNDFDGVWAPMETTFGTYRALFIRAVESSAFNCENPTTIPWLSVDVASGSTPVGESSTVQVGLDTSGLAPGDYEAGLCLVSNDPGRPLVVVPVSLTVTQGPVADLMFDPTSLDFGDVEVGSTSEALFATLQNTGDLDATGLTFGPTGGGFEADTSACGDTLSAGASCEVSVTFSPGEPGEAGATLQVDSDEGASAAAELSGNGVGDGGFTAMALQIDHAELVSDGNGVFEPGETVDVAPAWRSDGTVAVSLAGTASDLTGPQGPDYTTEAPDADYGLLEPGQTASCLDTEICYQMGVDDTAVRPATHWEATFVETLDDTDGTSKTWVLHIGDSFTDVPPSNAFYPSIETLLHSGVTGGCADSEYCPAGANSRAQMAVFVLKAAEDTGYEPPACVDGAEMFTDVPFDSAFCPWIEELAGRSVTSGCGGGNYCPGDSVTRAQMAVFLLKAIEGDGYEPSTCTGQFTDVPCPSLFADWIEDLAARGITGGCSADPPAYCPAAPVTRAQMAVFVTKTFGLTLYEP